MSAEYSVEEVRDVVCDMLAAYPALLRKPAEMLTAYADTLSKPAAAGHPTMTDMHREAFERWYSKDFYGDTCPPPDWSDHKHTYERFEDHLAWSAYQAALCYRDEQEKQA